MAVQAGGGCTTFTDSTVQTDAPTTMPEGLTVRHVVDAVRTQSTLTSEQILLQFIDNGVLFTPLQTIIVQSIAAAAMETIVAMGEAVREALAAPDHTAQDRVCALFQATAQRVAAGTNLEAEQRRWAGFDGPIFASMTAEQQTAYTAWCAVRFTAIDEQMAIAQAAQSRRARIWEETFLNEHRRATAAAAQKEIERVAARTAEELRQRRAAELDRIREEREREDARVQAAHDALFARRYATASAAAPAPAPVLIPPRDVAPAEYEAISDSDGD
jgi:hypothetical protein